jgi:hypothetical protein
MIIMRKKYYQIDRGEVRLYEYDGPRELFETDDEAWTALETRKAERIAALEQELSELKASD